MEDQGYYKKYTDEDDNEISFHDNKVHNIGFNGEDNEIIFSIDFITNYENEKYYISPSKLVFKNVYDMDINIHWVKSNMELKLLDISKNNKTLSPNKSTWFWDWEIDIAWPNSNSKILLTSTGYELYLLLHPFINDKPQLTFLERKKIFKTIAE